MCFGLLCICVGLALACSWSAAAVAWLALLLLGFALGPDRAEPEDLKPRTIQNYIEIEFGALEVKVWILTKKAIKT